MSVSHKVFTDLDMFLVSTSVLTPCVTWVVFCSVFMNSDFWLGAVFKVGFLSLGSLLSEGMEKVENWSISKSVLSRLLGVHLSLLTVGLGGLLPYSFQLLTLLPSLSLVLGSVWLSIVLGFIMLRGSTICASMVVSTPVTFGSAVMVLVEVVSAFLLIIVMPIRMSGNMLVGSVLMASAGLLFSAFPMTGSVLTGFLILLEGGVVIIQCHVVSILFIELLSTYNLNGR